MVKDGLEKKGWLANKTNGTFFFFKQLLNCSRDTQQTTKQPHIHILRDEEDRKGFSTNLVEELLVLGPYGLMEGHGPHLRLKEPLRVQLCSFLSNR